MVDTSAVRGWLSRVIGVPESKVRLTRMGGSTSSLLFRVDAATLALVLRLLDNAAWLTQEPDLAAHEATALDEAVRVALPAPRLVAHDDGSAIGLPVVLMTLLPGEVVLDPPNRASWLRGIAGTLAAIHRHPADGFPWHYRSWVDPAALVSPAWSARPALWAEAIERWRKGPPSFHPRFIHRDFHPTNLLWQEGRVSGVVDWINGCRGPAGVDVAHCRTNLALMVGPEEAEAFLEAYGTASPPYRHDPYWDLDSLLDMCLAGPTFYEPWATFGLARIPSDTLQQRVDDHLARVLAR